MQKANMVAESFLDGFGCLGAIFEPAVRPGSQENLIQENVISRTSVSSPVTGGNRLVLLPVLSGTLALILIGLLFETTSNPGLHDFEVGATGSLITISLVALREAFRFLLYRREKAHYDA